MKQATATIEPTSESTDDFTQTQAAKYLGVGYGAITLWVARGRLPFRRVAGIPIFKRSDLDKCERMKRGRVPIPGRPPSKKRARGKK